MDRLRPTLSAVRRSGSTFCCARTGAPDTVTDTPPGAALATPPAAATIPTPPPPPAAAICIGGACAAMAVAAGACAATIGARRRRPLFELLDGLLARDTHRVHLLDHVGFEALEHLGEHVEAFALVLLKRVALPVAAEPDAFLQMIHREQVLFPVLVDRLQRDDALEMARDVDAELLFAALVQLLDRFDDARLQILRRDLFLLFFGNAEPDAELSEHRVVERLPVPSRRGGVPDPRASPRWRWRCSSPSRRSPGAGCCRRGSRAGVRR
jgi:hypothetical protein